MIFFTLFHNQRNLLFNKNDNQAKKIPSFSNKKMGATNYIEVQQRILFKYVELMQKYNIFKSVNEGIMFF